MSAGGRFERWFDELAAIGRASEGGWHRFAWTDEDRLARDWFTSTAEAIGLAVEPDGNGNLWAWWGNAGPDAVATGSHLDTVAQGGAYDGALGVVSGLAAVAELGAGRGQPPPRPVAVVAFADEEGGRFNLPCFGSKLLTGALDPAAVLDRTDADGVTLAAAMTAAGVDPSGAGPDLERLDRIGAFVELHVEQGRALVDLDAPIGIGTAVWPHGRWRLTFAGEPNHAGTTRLSDRRDPLLAAASCIITARDLASRLDMVATVGRLVVEPNAPNAIAARVTASVDARAPDDATVDSFITELVEVTNRAAFTIGVDVAADLDARTQGVTFDEGLIETVDKVLSRAGIATAPLPTAAGHDAGIVAHHVPTTMLFVRNPTGASHTPSESATVDDCLVGVDALAAVLRELAW
jgi:beta-ureidopropionase / N-carbamoyl-L-amino-acid hydrolase